MKRFSWLICCLLTIVAHARIMEICKIDEICPHLDEDSLVIFDVDLVLVQPKDPAFQLVNMVKHRKIAQAITENLSPGEKDYLVNLMITGSEAILIEDQTPKMIEVIKNKGVKVIALTASYTGSIKAIDDMGNWRIKTLRDLGYDFTGAFPNVNRKVFTNFPEVNGDHPRFDQGIIFVNGGADMYTKGDVLNAFFLYSRFVPKKVLFVDDRYSNLEAVEKALPEGVEFIGFHYTGGAFYKGEAISKEVFKASWEALQ